VFGSELVERHRQVHDPVEPVEGAFQLGVTGEQGDLVHLVAATDPQRGVGEEVDGGAALDLAVDVEASVDIGIDGEQPG
jgi:hypothetical protein